MKENILITLLIVALLLIGVGTVRKDTIVVEPTILVEVPASTGAASGPDHFNRQIFHAGFQSGGFAFATSSTASAYTLTNTELGGDISYITWNAGLDITLTTMASTSPVFDAILGFQTGDKRTYDVYSSTSTTATTITWACGTGVDCQEDEGETIIQNGLEFARLTFMRKADTDIALEVEVFQVGD